MLFVEQAINRANTLHQQVENLKANITEKFNSKTLDPKKAIREVTVLSDVSLVSYFSLLKIP